MDKVEVRVRGQVQGVGFRPFVWQLAQRFGLSGEVLNDPEGVLIHVSGGGLAAFLEALRGEAPPLSRVDAVEVAEFFGDLPQEFVIVASTGQGAETRVTPDAATCSECLAEVSCGGRRHGYAFTNCTHCGPRFSILRALPYDRAQTTMASFDMCDACRGEYENPTDRRFHAQPIACPACGPRIWLEPDGGGDVIGEAAARLLRGEVLGIKGLGGFHLACDATNADAVEQLRARKRRPAKPFALMAAEDVLRAYAVVSDGEWSVLRDPAAPVVLLGKGAVDLPDGVAPGMRRLGWMLPYTPLHHLICAAVGRPLVMTSGNLSGEPQVVGNDEAREKLGGFVDGFLMHDREIARRLDDSVERLTPQGPMVLRRARGRVPETLPLPDGFADAPQGVAYGGQMKAALCVVKNGQALLSHHLGELDEALTWDEFVKADADYADLFDLRPEWVACDLHPDFRASRHAHAKGLPVVEVQHHHAHLASCLAENGWPLDGGKVAGIILDGLGLGADGTVWGGEVLLGDYAGYERRASLSSVPLVGGDMAQKEPWRNALAQLDAAGLSDWADRLFPDAPRDVLRMAAARGINAPMTSSAGRLFDAVAAVLGICPMRQSFEGEAAMRLEALAEEAPRGADDGYGFGPDLDAGPMWHAIRDDLNAGRDHAAIAWRFHMGLARAFADRARALVESGEARAVALSGGCFQNALLLDLTCKALGDVPVLVHNKVPANDGGLALGQAVVALAQAVRN